MRVHEYCHSQHRVDGSCSSPCSCTGCATLKNDACVISARTKQQHQHTREGRTRYLRQPSWLTCSDVCVCPSHHACVSVKCRADSPSDTGVACSRKGSRTADGKQKARIDKPRALQKTPQRPRDLATQDRRQDNLTNYSNSLFVLNSEVLFVLNINRDLTHGLEGLLTSLAS